jgi:hypothetical protein
MSNYVYPNFLLLWDEKIIEAKTDNSVYSLYQSGKLAFEKDNETIILLDRKTPITQNENCGEYDDIQTQKALCQYHFLMEKQNLPKDLLGIPLLQQGEEVKKPIQLDYIGVQSDIDTSVFDKYENRFLSSSKHNISIQFSRLTDNSQKKLLSYLCNNLQNKQF